MDYTEVTQKKPKNNDKVWVKMDDKSVAKIAVYRKGKFLDVSDESIVLEPKSWKYPNVPFFF